MKFISTLRLIFFPSRKSSGSQQGTPISSAGWLLFLIAALSPVALLSLFAFRTATQSVRELVQANNLSAASIAGDLVRDSFQRNLQLARTLAESPDFIAAVEAGDHEHVEQRLQSVMLLYPLIARVFITDAEDVLWSDYPSYPESRGRNLASQDWRQGLSNDHPTYVSVVYPQQGPAETLGTAVAALIRNERGERAGALVLQYKLEGITEGFTQISLGENGYVFLLDPQGHIAAHPRLELQKRLYAEYATLDAVQDALHGSPRTIEYRDPLTQEPMVGTFVPVEITGRRWIVVAEQPAADAYASLSRIAWNIGGAGGIVAVAMVLVIFGLQRYGERNRLLNLELDKHNQALERARNELMRSNQELELFSYVASHDLQEPLRMVSSYTQLLSQRYHQKLDEKADKYIEYSIDGARRMQQMIEGLLIYSRTSSRIKPKKRVDIRKILERILAAKRSAINTEKATITYDSSLPEEISADPAQLLQLFENLIDNAMKFRREAPPEIHISARKIDEDWQFSISDNGMGIDSNFHENVFVIFQRLNPHGPLPGTGVGLAICKKIVERHGGRIWVESEEGQGSTFHFTLPNGFPHSQ